MAELRSKMVGSVLVAACAAAVAGCGTDLGECDMMALGGSNVQGMLAPHSGQKLINNSCAGGTCHSELAEGKARSGAPAGLNFDVVPMDNSTVEVARALRAGNNVHDEAEEMWALIEGGDMPPEGKRAALNGADKETVRNWLACGAEIVAAPAQTGPVPPDLPSIHAALSGMACQACHSTGMDNNFLGGDVCQMYNAIVGKTAVSTGCGTSGLTVVVAGKPDDSLLWKKINASPPPPCGGTMPLGSATPLAGMSPGLAEAIRTWIANGAQKPASCP
jgi:hypothetical protein